LIRGESGTGKALVARSLRAQSSRRNAAFVKVNCAALPGELLESEMFGFERGAFSGALQAKPGKFEFANNGTIFLDEIGEMPASLQAKLLHVLQDGQFSRLGGQNDVRVDVRIIAATNRRLEEAVTTGSFREDLFFRLNVVCIMMPPLRARREEIPTLVRHFLTKYAAHYNKAELELPQETLSMLMAHSWPGNVRELENVIQRMILLGPEALRFNPVETPAPERRVASLDRRRKPRRPADIAAAAAQQPAAPAALEAPAVTKPRLADKLHSLKLVGRDAARAAERELMLHMLNRTRWNRKEAASMLGISYKALLYKIKEHKLDDPISDQDPAERA
jgi:two-component system, NtrC family, response regulator AtoC